MSRTGHRGFLSEDDYYIRTGRQLPPYSQAVLSEQNRPLIERVTNAWRDEKFNHEDFEDEDEDSIEEGKSAYQEPDVDYDCCEIDEEDPCLVATYSVIKTRRFRRIMTVLLVLTITIFYFWEWYVRPTWVENEWFYKGLSKKYNGLGTERPNKFHDYTFIRELGQDKIPGAEGDQEGKRRLVFVGDIHGCKKKLEKLLAKLDFNEQTDHLVATGDMISKGPDSAGVIDLLIAYNASAVLGNHEDQILLTLKSWHPRTNDQTIITGNIRPRDQELLETLRPHHLSWLRSLPLFLRIPAISPASATPPKHSPNPSLKKELADPILSEINVVHAGLVPAIPLLRQDPYSVMNMRSIEPDSHMPSARRDEGVPWEVIFNWFQERLFHGKDIPVEAELNEAHEEWVDDGDDHSTDMWDLKGEKIIKTNNFYPMKVPGTPATEDVDKKAIDIDRLRNEEESLGISRGLRDWFGGGGRSKKALRRNWPPKTVIYGHDSKRGLNLRPWTKGLDTGCVKVQQLTALVVDAWGRQNIVQVDC